MPSGDPSDSRRPGLIAAGIIAGLLGLLAIYLGYCAWLYRRQVRAYRSHLAVANRYSPAGASTASGLGGLAAFFGRRVSSRDGEKGRTAGAAAAAAVAARMSDSEKSRGRTHKRDTSTSTADSVGWSVPPAEPRLLFDDDPQQPTPESGYSSMSYPSGATGAGAGGLGSYPTRPLGWRSGAYGGSSGIASGSGSGATPGSRPTPGSGSGVDAARRSSGESYSSAERLLDGQEPSFFSVVMKPRRALRVVNGLEGEMENERE